VGAEPPRDKYMILWVDASRGSERHQDRFSRFYTRLTTWPTHSRHSDRPRYVKTSPAIARI